jgi:hypothetical protein
MLMFTPHRAIGLGLIPLLAESDPQFSDLEEGLKQTARHGWGTLDVVLSKISDEVAAMVDLPSPDAHRHPLEGLLLRVSDDALIRKLLELRLGLLDVASINESRSEVERLLQDRQLKRLVVHCLPGEGPIFDIVHVLEGGTHKSMIVAHSPRRGTPVRIAFDTKASKKSQATAQRVLGEVIDELLADRAAALGGKCDPTVIISLRKRDGIPHPSVHALYRAIEAVRKANEKATYSLSDYATLLELPDPPLAEMMQSTLYVSKAPKPAAYQLPRRPGARRTGTGGRFATGVKWTRDEVLTALKGWAARLGHPVPELF